MARLLGFFLLSGLSSICFASSDLNHIGCVYALEKSGWRLILNSSSTDKYNLDEGNRRVLSGAWTSHKPTGLNFAYCTAMVGTTSDNSVVIETYRYQATEFELLESSNDCTFKGTAVELISKESKVVQRGGTAELEIEWIPPYHKRLRVKEYFPTLEELNNLDEISPRKCQELSP